METSAEYSELRNLLLANSARGTNLDFLYLISELSQLRNSAAKRLERSVVPATPSQRATEETILEKMAMSQVTTAPGTVVDEGLEQLEEVLGDLQANRLPAMDMIVAKLRKTSLADDASLREVRLGLQLLKQGATQIDNALILLQSRK